VVSHWGQEERGGVAHLYTHLNCNNEFPQFGQMPLPICGRDKHHKIKANHNHKKIKKKSKNNELKTT